MRKIRMRILPLIFVLYTAAFIDRINVGFAALTMNRELGISSEQFGLLAAIFFLGYVPFEIPSNLLMHRIGARVWIARIMLTWGIVASLTGLAHNLTELCIARFLLGVAEAGFFPGIVLYLTYWFRQREQAGAIALFMTALPVASVVGAPLSGLVLDHAHWMGLSSWRWLLLLEGVPSVVLGLLTYWLLPSRPSEAKFLTAEEKDWLDAELKREERQKGGLEHASAAQALKNHRVWRLAGTAFLWDVGLYWMSFWMPQKLKSLSALYSNTTVGLLVMIPQLVGLVGMVLVSRSSDRKSERRYHAGIPVAIGGAALLSLLATQDPLASVIILSVMAAGLYSYVAPFFSIPSEFLTGQSAASGIALINSVANAGAFVGPYLIGVIDQRTGGLTGGMIFTGVSLTICGALVMSLPRKWLAGRAFAESR